MIWVPIDLGNLSGSCSENCGFRIAQVVRCHSESGMPYSENHLLNSESCSENTLELSESSESGLFTLRAFFPEIGVVPGFWILCESQAVIVTWLLSSEWTKVLQRFAICAWPPLCPTYLIWPLPSVTEKYSKVINPQSDFPEFLGSALWMTFF